jgi:hypothetical protein
MGAVTTVFSNSKPLKVLLIETVSALAAFGASSNTDGVANTNDAAIAANFDFTWLPLG